MSEKHYIEIDNKYYEYYINYSKRRTTILKFDEEGKWIIYTNKYVPIKSIENFVRKDFEKIIKKQNKVLQQRSINFESCLSQDYFYYFGKKLNLIKVQSNFNGVKLDENNIYVYYKLNVEDCDKTMIKFIKKEAARIYPTFIDKYQCILDDYHLEYPTVSYRFMKSRWGSCTMKKNKISLNLYLLHYDQRFLEYVVVHELAHFIQPNHSKKFYEVIEFYLPDYKKYQKSVSVFE